MSISQRKPNSPKEYTPNIYKKKKKNLRTSLSFYLCLFFKKPLHEEIIYEFPLGQCLCFSGPEIMGGGGNGFKCWEEINTKG